METKLFDFNKFDIKLDTDWLGRNFLYFEEIDSTNSFLLHEKEEKFPSGTIVLAEQQHKGRGRMNRVWYSAKGQNLTFSILLNSERFEKLNLNMINFATAIVVANSINNLFQLNTEYKWPNDVLVSGKKISGILLESVSFGNKIEKLVIGVGLNVNQPWFQGNYSIPPTSIRIENKNEIVSREKLLTEILNNFEIMLKKIELNPSSIIKDWRFGCRMIGERITVHQGTEEHYGVFHDVDENGLLILRSQDGTFQKFNVGEVSLV